jgi:hypothetical protein
MLQIARAEVLGEGGLPPIGGIVSLMRHLCGRVVKVNQQVYLPGLKCSQPILSFRVAKTPALPPGGYSPRELPLTIRDNPFGCYMLAIPGNSGILGLAVTPRFLF